MPLSFVNLPVETNLQILRECGPNDITCLSLTCKFLWRVSREFRVFNPKLSTVDSTLCFKEKCSRSHQEGQICRRLSRHRGLCHQESYVVNESLVEPRDVENWIRIGLHNCKTPSWTTHCECFVVTLYKRLETWMPGDLKFCQNCRKFTSKCSRDNSVCTTNVKRAMFDLREKEYWKILAQQRSLVIRAGWEERGIVTAAGSSMMGAAMTWEAQERIRETWESMQRARRLEMQAAKEDMKRREEELKRKEEELKRKERDLRKREEELWRRKDKVQMLEGKVRQREKEVRSREEIVKKGKRSEAGRRSGWEEIKRGFARCPCKTP